MHMYNIYIHTRRQSDKKPTYLAQMPDAELLEPQNTFVRPPEKCQESTNLSEQNKITFKVNAKANKKNLKNNIEKIFKVNVTKINIINKKTRIKTTRGKKVRVKGFKKAIITLKKGQNIDLTTGI